MDFEQALATELDSITGIQNKVFPVQAPEGTLAPYVTYLKGEVRPLKTLQGMTRIMSGNYEINILATSYSRTQSIYKLIKDKFRDMQQRVIGVDGPFMQDIAIEDVKDLYEFEVDLYRVFIEFKVTYEEE